MKRQLIPFFILGVAVLFAATRAQSTAAPAVQAQEADEISEFEGKVVTIYLAGTKRGSGNILTDAKLIEIGGRVMIVGTGADTGREENWTTGMRIGIPWDSVISYYAMTEEQFEEKILGKQMH